MRSQDFVVVTGRVMHVLMIYNFMKLTFILAQYFAYFFYRWLYSSLLKGNQSVQ